MPLWGKNDASSNAVLFAPAQVGQTANAGNAQALYNNTTPNAYRSGATIGLYGVSGSEAANSGGTVSEIVVTFAGSGYTGNAAVTVSEAVGGTNATSNATANATGRISAVNIVTAGAGYTANPTITVAAPAALTFSGNSTNVTVGNSTVNGFITLGTANVAVLTNNDVVTYLVGTGNTAIGGLANNTAYYVITANSTAIQLAATASGPAINLTSVGTGAQAGHSLTGQTATATSALSGGRNKGVNAGWNLRTVGSGGRAGRVQYECLVAMRNMTGDGSDDGKLPE